MKQIIDIPRCMKAMQYIRVTGDPRSTLSVAANLRQEVIADAIAAIQDDGQKALTEQYLGVFTNEHDRDACNKPRVLNLCDLLSRRDRIKDELDSYDAAISEAKVEAHV